MIGQSYPSRSLGKITVYAHCIGNDHFMESIL